LRNDASLGSNVILPEEYDPDEWYNYAKMEKPIDKDTSYYKFNKAATIHLEFVKTCLENDGIPLSYGEQIIPSVAGSIFTLAKTEDERAVVIYYFDKSNHVYMLNRWIAKDLTTEASGPLAGPNGSLTILPIGSYPVVYYTDTNGHIWELQYYNGRLNAGDLTLAAGGQHPVKSGSTLLSMSNANFTAVYYLDSNNHVCELRYENKKWNISDFMPSADNN
jgi:hypothetical protein